MQPTITSSDQDPAPDGEQSPSLSIDKPAAQTLCPSAQPDWEDSRLFAVVGGSSDHPELAYLKSPLPVTEDLLKLASPVTPAEVFRFAAHCACSDCAHFASANSKCRLAEKIVRWAPIVVNRLPSCAIRLHCRWWQQEGRAACLRCPQVITTDFHSSEEIRRAADPAQT